MAGADQEEDIGILAGEGKENEDETEKKGNKLPPFDKNQSTALARLYHTHVASLALTSKTEHANAKRNNAWRRVALDLFAETGVRRTVSQVKSRWNVIQSKAKSDNAMRKRKLKETGGGKRPDDLDDTSQAVVDAVGICDRFDGLKNGIASPLFKKPAPAIAAPVVGVPDKAKFEVLDDQTTPRMKAKPPPIPKREKLSTESETARLLDC